MVIHTIKKIYPATQDLRLNSDFEIKLFVKSINYFSQFTYPDLLFSNTHTHTHTHTHTPLLPSET
jgi:hypothetical protein